MPRATGGVISQVRPGSVGAEVGLEPGDVLLSINGHTLRDIIDYRYYAADETLVLRVRRGDERHTLEIERDYDEDLGLQFAQPLFDGLRLCNNACPFCFVRQMPRGLRRTLYLHDDDYRLSFLSGSFVTLTNLTEDDWERIAEQRLSPLYVSVHATDLQTRRRALGNPSAPDIMQQLRRLGGLRIRVHAQIVISPGINYDAHLQPDGDVLSRSIDDLLSLWPSVQTLALVPVGLIYRSSSVAGPRSNRGCPAPDQIGGALRPEEAAAILDLAKTHGRSARQHTRSTWLFPSDELYLLAGYPIPDSAFYDDDAQRENGVGLVRALLDDWQTARGGASTLSRAGRITLACGTLIAPLLSGLAAELGALSGAQVHLVPISNRLFGPTVTVSGLLSGEDVIAALGQHDVGEAVFLPRAMFDARGKVTLDDITIDEIAERLGAPVYAADTLSQVVGTLAKRR